MLLGTICCVLFIHGFRFRSGRELHNMLSHPSSALFHACCSFLVLGTLELPFGGMHDNTLSLQRSITHKPHIISALTVWKQILCVNLNASKKQCWATIWTMRMCLNNSFHLAVCIVKNVELKIKKMKTAESLTPCIVELWCCRCCCPWDCISQKAGRGEKTGRTADLSNTIWIPCRFLAGHVVYNKRGKTIGIVP